jgi:hypothetical protein
MLKDADSGKITFSTFVGPSNYLKLLIPQHFEKWVDFCFQVDERE